MARPTKEKVASTEATETETVTENTEMLGNVETLAGTEQPAEIQPHSSKQERQQARSQNGYLYWPNDDRPVRAYLLGQASAVNLRAGQLLVICSRPGFRRAGVEHPHVKIWDRGELTPEQIVDLQREPLITVVEFSEP